MNIPVTIKFPFALDLREHVESLCGGTIESAEAKWGRNLSEDERAAVVNHTYKQVAKKIEQLSFRWVENESITIKTKITVDDMDDDDEILCKQVKPERIVINIPEDLDKYPNLRFRRHLSNILLDDDSTIPLSEIEVFFLREISSWVDVSVFYGVGSYAGQS